MAETFYEVINVDELTVTKEVAVLTQPDGSKIRQNGLGKVYLKGERIPESEISPDFTEALDDEDNPMHKHVVKKLKKVSGDGASEDIERRLGLPFEGYDDMEEEELVAAMRHLPSPVVSRIRQYEATKEEPRERVLNFNVGFGEDPDLRQLGKVGSDVQDAEEGKPSSELQTREVPDDGPVIQGEGVTGIGVPAKGKLKDPSTRLTGIKGASAKKSAQRKGRRERTESSDKGDENK